ncbi:hypothetical protein V2J09_012983 [Rumex salicifolius]
MTWRLQAMEVNPEGSQARFEKAPRTRLKAWFVRVCSGILLWTCLVQLVAVGELWQPRFITGFSNVLFHDSQSPPLRVSSTALSPSSTLPPPPTLLPPPTLQLPPALPARNYTSNGFLLVTCNGGLNQMRAAICDMVTVARLLNLTLVVPELDKTSFWADTSDFDDIFDSRHFIDSLRSEVNVIKRLPKRFNRKYGFQPLVMQPVSWSNGDYYLQQILPLFSKHKVIHFNKTDARLANNGLPHDIQKHRCHVNFQALKFNSKIEDLGHKLVRILQEKGPFIALHLRYEMDMLAFSGCTHGCTEEEAEELKRLRYAFPWWREKEINSDDRRSGGLCPLTPEEASLVLQALGFDNRTHIYIASGEIYGSGRRLKALRNSFPHIVSSSNYALPWICLFIIISLLGKKMFMKKETLLDSNDLKNFRNHSSQMAALDFMVSVASDLFIPTYDGNMAKVVEGHRRRLWKKNIELQKFIILATYFPYLHTDWISCKCNFRAIWILQLCSIVHCRHLGFKTSLLLNRKRIVELIDLHQNGTMPWDEFVIAVKEAHANRTGQPVLRRVIPDKPKEEDYFYANPQECLCENISCNDLQVSHKSSFEFASQEEVLRYCIDAGVKLFEGNAIKRS